MNGLSQALLSNNPNLNPANGTGAANPFRLDRSQAVAADQDHDYPAEQQAFDMGLLDRFPLYDDSDGWDDHQMGPIVNQFTGPADAWTTP